MRQEGRASIRQINESMKFWDKGYQTIQAENESGIKYVGWGSESGKIKGIR
jgi:galactose-1-phosphate uridylyltransferase